MKKYNKLFILTGVIGAFMFSFKTQKSAQEPLTNKEKKYINRVWSRPRGFIYHFSRY